jgi:hypothetical protein
MPLGIHDASAHNMVATHPFCTMENYMQRKDIRSKGVCSNRRNSPSNRLLQLNPRSQKSHPRHSLANIFRSNLRHARIIWGELRVSAIRSLRDLSYAHALSVAAGDIQLLEGRWYVTHAGLLSIASRSGCSAITTAIDRSASEPSIDRWVFKATVYKALCSKGFMGYGDANPSNVSPLVRGAEMRVAETRAVNRALRKAYGIGLCSVEELGSFSAPPPALAARPHSNGHAGANGSSNGQPRLRDQLCLLIRRHDLDPTLVKAYAADFCGTATLKDASRDLVESFITQLAAAAKKDRDGLLCKLNSYAQHAEVNP